MKKQLFFYGVAIYWFFSNTAHAQTSNSLPAANPQKSNPAISLNLLTLGRIAEQGGSENAERPNGFLFQEAELRLSSNIDTYFRGDAVLAIHQEDGEFELHPEEIFVETLFIPSATLKVGKFYAQFGRHNHLHTHLFPFVDQPISNKIILGEEALNEIGIALSYLVPVSWYMEVIAQAFSATNEVVFNSPSNNDLAAIGYLRNLWELSPASTIELGIGYGTGKNNNTDTSQIYIGSITYKWRPIKKTLYKSFLWTAEYLGSSIGSASGQQTIGGITSWFQWQFARRFWLQGRGEYLGLPDAQIDSTQKYSALFGFVPTEYSAIRLQYDITQEPTTNQTVHGLTLQLNVSLGTHPAHHY